VFRVAEHDWPLHSIPCPAPYFGVSSDLRTQEVICSETCTRDIFITHGLANYNIAIWATTHVRERFSWIFNSRAATFSRPNGVYLIPIFSGNISWGHWHLSVIQKINSPLCQGWVLDSLGQGQTTSSAITWITEALTNSKRSRFIWKALRCSQQTEC